MPSTLSHGPQVPEGQLGVSCVRDDPIIVGFDGKTFHFDSAGEFVLLESADGYKVRRTLTHHNPSSVPLAPASPCGMHVTCCIALAIAYKRSCAVAPALHARCRF